MAPLNPLSRILDDNRLTGVNSLEWLNNFKIILTAADKIKNVITTPCPNDLSERAIKEEIKDDVHDLSERVIKEEIKDDV
ncbi:hypothetical protein, partial [Geminicoccus harenae]|uniref:hypothetical protein n=1 Tax=Geminicoccus harenae TaxID=2498453 RepID=UPI001C96EA2C